MLNGFILFGSSQTAHHGPTMGVTLFFACFLVALVVCLALEEKLHAKKSVIAGIFAVVTLLLAAIFNILPTTHVVVGSKPVVEHTEFEASVPVEGANTPDASVEKVDVEAVHKRDGKKQTHEAHPVHIDGHEIEMPIYIPAIDWAVIAIIFGSSLFVDAVSKSGLFTWVAIKVTKASRGDPLLLLIFYGVMTVVFSAVLNNVTAMIIIGSLTAVSLQKLDQRDKLLSFLLVEGLLTNLGGLLTLISSVPNIIVGTTASISFAEFFVKSAPYVLIATALTLWLGAKLFGIKKLADEEAKEHAAKLVASFDENDGIESKFRFYFGAVMTLLFIVTIATTSILPWISSLGMGFVALSFAAIMLLQHKSSADKLYQAIDWDLLGFFAALFVVINVMEHAMVLHLIGGGLELLLALPEKLGTVALLAASAVFSSVTDNIPLAAMLSKILAASPAEFAIAGNPSSPYWWSVILGANLGGNLTPIGSASTLVAVTIMHKHKLEMTFGKFVKVAFPFAVMQIALAAVYVVILGFLVSG